MASERRTERDSMGELRVPADAYYGAQTMRAVLNFPISDLRFPPSFIRALGQIKLAAAEVNRDLGLLDPETADAIVRAAREVADGKLDDQFVVDVFQTGSGTSTNMNANEVISNRAIEMLGGELGSRDPVHPNDHVNAGQSSNDVIPTAIHVAALSGLHGALIPALEHLRAELESQGGGVHADRQDRQDAPAGRDAHPARPGVRGPRRPDGPGRQASEGRHCRAVRGRARRHRRGHGSEQPSRVRRSAVCARLSDMLGATVTETDNHFQAQSSLDGVVECSGALKTVAVSLMKIANDIRWLGSGPRAGLGEIELPEVQPGSSIMPGKVNPVIPESVCQVAAQVIGNDAAITVAGQSGNFEINVMMPVAAHNLLESIDILASASRNLADQCVSGLKATSRGADMVHQGLAIVTTLVPHVGYDRAAAIAKEAQATGRTVREVAAVSTDLSDEELDRILDPATMTDPRLAPRVSLG